jgi:TRAP-type transport system small permease protein
VLLAIFLCVMIVVGIRYATLTWTQTTPVMQIPVGAVYLAMPVGFALMTIHLVVMGRGFVARRAVLGDGEFDADAVKL